MGFLVLVIINLMLIPLFIYFSKLDNKAKQRRISERDNKFKEKYIAPLYGAMPANVSLPLPENENLQYCIDNLMEHLQSVHKQSIETIKQTYNLHHIYKSSDPTFKGFAFSQNTLYYGIFNDDPFLESSYSIYEDADGELCINQKSNSYNSIHWESKPYNWYGETNDRIRRQYPFDSCFKIPFENIKFYTVQGDKQYITNLSGGGVNMQAAITGGLLFGSTGAIIGSNIGTELRTTTETKDDRKILLYYTRLNTQKVLTITENIDFILEVFRREIPKKDALYLAYNKQQIE